VQEAADAGGDFDERSVLLNAHDGAFEFAVHRLAEDERTTSRQLLGQLNATAHFVGAENRDRNHSTGLELAGALAGRLGGHDFAVMQQTAEAIAEVNQRTAIEPLGDLAGDDGVDLEALHLDGKLRKAHVFELLVNGIEIEGEFVQRGVALIHLEIELAPNELVRLTRSTQVLAQDEAVQAAVQHFEADEHAAFALLSGDLDGDAGFAFERALRGDPGFGSDEGYDHFVFVSEGIFLGFIGVVGDDAGSGEADGDFVFGVGGVQNRVGFEACDEHESVAFILTDDDGAAFEFLGITDAGIQELREWAVRVGGEDNVRCFHVGTGCVCSWF